jgi:hypothetical protein
MKVHNFNHTNKSIQIAINSPLKILTPASWHLVKHRLSELKRLNNFSDANIALAPWIEKYII